MKTKILLAITILAMSSLAQALESFIGQVTVVEPTYLPGSITFLMNAGNSTCPSGTWLKWKNADIENNKAVYSTLMAALLSRENIKLYINDGDTTCVGQFLHLQSY